MKATMAWRCRACDDLVKDYLCVPLDEDEDPEEEELEEEEPQEEEDMDIDDEEDKNESKLTFPYEEPKDKTVPASLHEVGESSTAHFLQEDSDGLFPGLMQRDIKSLFDRMTSLSRRLCGRDTMHVVVEKKGKGKDEYYEKAECKKLKKELEEARFSNTLLRMQNERVKRDLYWTRVRAHEFYREMIRMGFVMMPPKSAPMTQAAIQRMIKESVDVAIAVERARQANVKNNARGSGPVRGQDTAPVVCKCIFARFMKCNPIVFRGTEGTIELQRWFEKTEGVFGISECAEGKKVKFADATLKGPALT
ncbi:hypothetical protein Tco_0785213 [Tanacetum coccineum]